MLWMAALGGGGLGFDSIDELNSGNDVGQELAAVEESPFLGGGLHQLEDHREASGARAVALGAAMPQADGGERAFDRVGGSQVDPVLGREVVEGEQHVAILRQALGGLGILGLVGLQEQIERLARHRLVVSAIQI